MLRLVGSTRANAIDAQSRWAASASSSSSTPRPGPVRQAQQVAVEARLAARRSWPRTAAGSRARGRARRPRPRTAAPAPRAPRRRSRAGRRGRSRGRSAGGPAIPFASPIPPTFASFTVASSQAPARGGALGVLAALDALVGGDRDRGRAADLGELAQVGDRLLDQLDVERLDHRAARRAPRRRSRRRWRRAGSAASGRAPRAPPAPGRRRRRPPSLSLKVVKPARRPALGVGGHRARDRPATSVALQRDRGGLGRAEQRHSGCPDALPARSKIAISSAAFAGPGSRRPAATWMKVSTAARSGSSPEKSERSRAAEAARGRAAAPRSIARQVGAAAQRQRHRLAETLEPARRCAGARAASRAVRACRARSCTALRTAARTGPARPRSTFIRRASSRPAASSRLKAPSRAPVCGEGAVQRRAVGARRAPPGCGGRAPAARRAARSAPPPARRPPPGATASTGKAPPTRAR